MISANKCSGVASTSCTMVCKKHLSTAIIYKNNFRYLCIVLYVKAKIFFFQRNVEINVNCKVYARNIVDDDRMQVGYYNFKIQIDD